MARKRKSWRSFPHMEHHHHYRNRKITKATLPLPNNNNSKVSTTTIDPHPISSPSSPARHTIPSPNRHVSWDCARTILLSYRPTRTVGWMWRCWPRGLRSWKCWNQQQKQQQINTVVGGRGCPSSWHAPQAAPYAAPSTTLPPSSRSAAPTNPATTVMPHPTVTTTNAPSGSTSTEPGADPPSSPPAPPSAVQRTSTTSATPTRLRSTRTRCSAPRSRPRPSSSDTATPCGTPTPPERNTSSIPVKTAPSTIWGI
mmetsp:Transcript_22604/g.40455  ORF Transcript_22604/g.40455 Transcript_22604/m.40455 type:complete len:255 (+) Transcript_22604:1468-2232(+)